MVPKKNVLEIRTQKELPELSPHGIAKKKCFGTWNTSRTGESTVIVQMLNEKNYLNSPLHRIAKKKCFGTWNTDT